MATFNEKIFKERICDFYLSNKALCDKNYLNAENPKMANIYIDIVDKEEINNLFTMTSVVILTANKYEKNVLHFNQYLNSNEKIKRISIDLMPNATKKEPTYAYFFKWHNYYILHIHALHTGSYTIGGSADVTRFLINHEHLFPTAVISLGICFGTNENKYELGDVVISEKIYPYFMGSKITEKGYFVNDDNVFAINQALKRDIQGNIIDTNQFNNLQYKVYMGNYITGEAIVSKKEARDALVKDTTLQEVIAGEMEGYGVFKECNSHDSSNCCLVVKSICDWAILKNFDCKNIMEERATEKGIEIATEYETLKDRLQAYASYNAYETLDKLLLNNIFSKSVYDTVLEQILELHNEKAIYESRIKTIIKSIIRPSTYKKSLQGMISLLIKTGALEPDGSNKNSKNKAYLIRRECN